MRAALFFTFLNSSQCSEVALACQCTTKAHLRPWHACHAGRYVVARSSARGCIHQQDAKRMPRGSMRVSTGTCVCLTSSKIGSASSNTRLVTVMIATRAPLSAALSPMTICVKGMHCVCVPKPGNLVAVMSRFLRTLA